MKSIHISIFLSLLVVGFSSCYEEPDWLAENVTPGRGNFPVISTFGTTNGSEFAAGETVQLDLRFFSVDEIDRIVLSSIIDAVETEEETFAYTPNFAEDSQTDKLLMSYTIPANLPATVTKVILKVEIINKNGLTRDASVTVDILM
ncbi:hypothetical protein [Lewinella sp. LCG006]|uniref:hypothetical protein n=1 Tax=Lewinella sp. LCG006 TaxID=3231911 RepID=UPI003460DFCC